MPKNTHQLKRFYFKFWINRICICYLQSSKLELPKNLNPCFSHYINRNSMIQSSRKVFKPGKSLNHLVSIDIMQVIRISNFSNVSLEVSFVPNSQNRFCTFFVSWKIIVIVVRSLISLTTWWLDFHAHVAHR